MNRLPALGRSLTASIANARVLEPEWLETASPGDAERNLRDLVRINRWFGGHRVLLRVLEHLAHPLDRFSVLDIGAASGDAGGRICRAYSNAKVISLDCRVTHLRSARAPRVVADAFALPFTDGSFDFVLCSLLLHHFPDAAAAELIRRALRLARHALVIVELQRHPFSYLFLPLTRWLFRWSDLTIHDGQASVAAAFRTNELRAMMEQAGARETGVHTHWPWFRISAVIPRAAEPASGLEAVAKPG